LSLYSERVITFSKFSAAQKRPCAKGRSREIHSTTVFSSPEAFSLNLRTDAAQVPVSMLGKIFNTTFFPLKSCRLFSDKSPAVKLKSGAEDPTAGKSPFVCTAVPLNVILAMISNFKNTKDTDFYINFLPSTFPIGKIMTFHIYLLYLDIN